MLDTRIPSSKAYNRRCTKRSLELYRRNEFFSCTSYIFLGTQRDWYHHIRRWILRYWWSIRLLQQGFLLFLAYVPIGRIYSRAFSCFPFRAYGSCLFSSVTTNFRVSELLVSRYSWAECRPISWISSVTALSTGLVNSYSIIRVFTIFKKLDTDSPWTPIS